MELTWLCKPFDELASAELYSILQLRSEVFVVEQNCVYLDLDGKDVNCFHLWALDNNAVVAYARLVPPGISYEYPSIGRVVSSPTYRRSGSGRLLMQKAIEECNRLFGQQTIKIGAQLYLKKFYNSFGFEQTGDVYDEDGIDHIHMLRTTA